MKYAERHMRNNNFHSGRGDRSDRRAAIRKAIAIRAIVRGSHGRLGMGHGRFGHGADGFEGGPRGGWGAGGFGGGGQRGGGRRRRLFDQAELQILLLALIAEQPRHGYDLIREIEALSGGEYAPSPGVIYPALTYMEDAGLIVPVADQGSRKAFEATEPGRARAEEDAAKAASLKERLGALAEQRDKIDPAPVRRAMHALKTAVFDRLSHEGADRALILQVADAIDEATRKIERIEA